MTYEQKKKLKEGAANAGISGTVAAIVVVLAPILETMFSGNAAAEEPASKEWVAESQELLVREMNVAVDERLQRIEDSVEKGKFSDAAKKRVRAVEKHLEQTSDFETVTFEW